MGKRIIFNGFTQCCMNHHSEGLWKHPQDGSSRGYTSTDYWVDLARLLERGCFDGLFLADVHGTYNIYRGSRDAAVAHAVQFPSNDPTVIIPLMAHATRHLGFACTYSTTYFAPYHCAKLFSTLDHLSGGRAAWNIVTSYLADANANFGIEEVLGHDDRYERAEEYMEVCYKLWEHSWEDDAVVRDPVRDMYADPAKVHEIHHDGAWFKVNGPHMCEPSPQRTPLLFQAGQSGRGMLFAAKHAEAVFAIHPTIAASAASTRRIHEAAAGFGRAPEAIKICQGITVVVAPSDEEAQMKYETALRYASPEGALALFSGWTGVDLALVDGNRQVHEFESNAITSLLGFFKQVDPDRAWTMNDIKHYMALGSIQPKIIGSPQTVADELERWADEGLVDGFNLVPIVQPGGFRDFVELVVPELQRRGRMRTHYEGRTLRENYFGAGHARLPSEHTAHAALPPWKRAARRA
ncbi:MAG: LLM class flavin-dependent oxidoreductase [Gammaproteobacteria bacterium]